METVRFKLTVAYIGTRYHGWQVQARTDIDLPTIQRFLETTASRICETKIHVHGAGRTDSGVHAEAQVAHMDVPLHKAGVDWQLAFNTSMPPDIRVMRVERVPDTFHAQFSALRKRYTYRLWLSRRCTPPWLQPYVWACGGLDLHRMDTVARMLEGRHDFTSLRNRGTALNSTVRTVYAISREPEELQGYCEGDRELSWTFEANGFLKQMVRNTVGLMVAVGKGKIEVKRVPEILSAQDRRHPAITAPAQGLILREVVYEAVEESSP